jgi:hypothetical protein
MVFSFKFKFFIAFLSSLRCGYPMYDSQLRLDFLKSHSNPSLSLITVFTLTHRIRVNSHLTHNIFNVIGSLNADVEFEKHTQTVQGYCFFQIFLQATNGRLIENCQLPFKQVQLLLSPPLRGCSYADWSFQQKFD